MKKSMYSINFIGSFFCFFLLSFFSFHPNAYPAPLFYFDTVQKIYIGYYQRPADPGGLIYWAGRLDNAGGSFAEIIEAYANSAESQALYGTINSGNISNVVNGIYNALFGRPAEPEGLNYYVNGFNLGQFTPATIMLNVLYGAQNEDLQSVNNKLTAANLFTGTIDPELDGTNFRVTYAGDGDAIAARNFLALSATSVKVPTQAETTAYIRTNIANPGDPILSYTINAAYLQYRNYENSANNRYAAWLAITKVGAPIEAADVASVQLTDSAGNPVIPTSLSFSRSPPYYFYNCSTSPCTQSDNNIDSGLTGNFAYLPADDYKFEFEAANGQNFTADVTYTGQLVLPFVASATMQAQSSNGDLVLSWTNPTGNANWAEVDQFRIIVLAADGTEVIYIRANPADKTVTIPASLVSEAANLGHGALSNWQIQTRAFDANGMNFARGYSRTVTLSPYTQTDLTGTWRMNMLGAGSDNGWMSFLATVDSYGLLTVSSFLDSTGSTGLPDAGSIQWTINESGVISESGVNSASNVHMTMTSNKNFIAGTGGGSHGRQLRIAQKVVPGTVYTNADLQNKSFVYHQLSVGGSNRWEYGVGTTDAAGLVTITSDIDSSGPRTPEGPFPTISVDGSGTVTMSAGVGMDNFQGFLSDDKKTIVGTVTETGKTNYELIILQITGQTYTAGLLPAGISAAHMLACGSTLPAPFWLHFTCTVASGGVISFSDWVSSNSGVTAPGTTHTGSITSSGTVTIAGNPTYHGQVSHDSKFIVATQTNAAGVYSLQVNTK